MILDYAWNTLENWFINGGIETRIIGIILAIVISILAIWFTFEILKLTFLLVIEFVLHSYCSISDSSNWTDFRKRRLINNYR